MDSKQNTVDDHRNMLMLTKKISDFQENNLKSWSFIFFDGVDKTNVSWDFFKKNKGNDFYAGSVLFDIALKKNVNADVDAEKIQLGVDRLIASTKFLFWSETDVKIKINGKLWKTKLQKQETISTKTN